MTRLKKHWRVQVLALVCLALASACEQHEPQVPAAGLASSLAPAAERPTGPAHSPWPFAQPEGGTIVGSADARQRLGDAPARVLAAIDARDFAALAEWVHPVEGLRLSPYSFVDKQQQVILDAHALRSANDSNETYLWGYADGTGDPIVLPIKQYFDRYVYVADFAVAPQVSFDRSIGHGNSIDNAREAYPDAAIVEYHFPYLDEAMAGLDWKSLRLVFRQHAGKWFLCGIVRDVWTI